MAAEGIAATAYGRKSRELVALMTQLRACGASADLDLPRIAVIGNQSAGKSSLVEAISGIKVPRDAGTCTRCPMEVRLRCADTPWSCRISLRFERDVHNKPVESVREISFGPVLTKPSAVEAALRRAQLAILNPSVHDVQYFLDLSDEQVRLAKEGHAPSASNGQLSFSTNLVCLDISGPSIADLAFVDLPGIISNSDNTDDITLIESMVRDNIKGNCLILLTITMKDDYQNRKAVMLAKAADTAGERTIGVLTKADTVERGEHGVWIDMLAGRKNQLLHGFFATKQPGPAELEKNLTFEEARAAEAEYFKTQAPWSNLDLGLKSRFGIANLTKFLSDRLGEYIAGKLPDLHQHLLASHTSVLDQIKDLPDAPSADPVAELHVRLASLNRDLDALVRGDSGFGQLIQAKNRNDRRFKAVIRATRPAFVPFESKQKREIEAWTKKQQSSKRRKVDSASKSALAAPAASIPPAPVFNFSSQATSTSAATSGPSFAFGLPAAANGGPSPFAAVTSTPLAAEESAANALTTSAIDSDDEDGEVAEPNPSISMKLDEVRKHILERKAREVPLNTPYGARQSLMIQALENWTPLTQDALKRTLEPVKETVEAVTASYFGRSGGSELRSIAMMVCSDVLEELSGKASDRLSDLVALEAVPFTQNTHYFQTTRDGALNEYKAARKKNNPQNANEEDMNDALAALAKIGLSGVTAEQLAQLHEADPFEEELEAAAMTVAYWKVAYKRIIDDVPRIIDFSLIRPLPRALSAALLTKLVSGGDAEIKRLMSESPDVAELRADLALRKKRLEEAKKVLAAFGSGL